MGGFFAELRRRHIYRVGAGYVVVAWGIAQVIDFLSQVWALPDSIAQPITIVLAIGFPVTLIAAWLIEGKAHETVASAVRSPATKIDYALFGALAFVLAGIGYQQFASNGEMNDVAAGSVPAGEISIAVLPFANMSADAEQEYFSDGMTEEITSVLARIPNLRVVGRTSAFQYKDRNENLRTIGEELNAAYLIEGSVRRDGDRVRITAQLIQSDDGTHLWVENFDRQLNDIFAVQEEIAAAISDSLRVPLGLDAGNSLVPSRTADLDSYQDYLKAKALIRARGPLEPGGPITEAIALLEQVVARDPGYAPAWATLGGGYAVQPFFSKAFFGGTVEEIRALAEQTLPSAEAAAQRAILLDPNNADAYAALSFVNAWRGNWVDAEDLAEKALSLDPANAEALQSLSGPLGVAGRINASLETRERMQAVEPFVPIFNAVTGFSLRIAGRNDEAAAILEDVPDSLYFRALNFAAMDAKADRFDDAADILQSMPAELFPPGAVDAAAELLRTAPNRTTTPQDLPALGGLSFVYLHVGAPERVFDTVDDGLAGGIARLTTMMELWDPSAAELRKTERFKTYVRTSGIYDYWRARGFADLCRPVGDDDFECD